MYSGAVNLKKCKEKENFERDEIIMVVDDQPINIKVLEKMIEKRGLD